MQFASLLQVIISIFYYLLTGTMILNSKLYAERYRMGGEGARGNYECRMQNEDCRDLCD
jgi:hypothetical protein